MEFGCRYQMQCKQTECCALDHPTFSLFLYVILEMKLEVKRINMQCVIESLLACVTVFNMYRCRGAG